MNFKIKILEEYGYESAMLGLSLSYNRPICDMKNVTDILYNKDGGHNKVLESLQIWLDVTAPRYFWSELDTYRSGITKLSESTMHTITKKVLKQENFVEPIFEPNLCFINKLIKEYDQATERKRKHLLFRKIKRNLPEGFLQRRTINTNYKTLRNMIIQRKNHELEEWPLFCIYLQENCKFKEWLK